MDKISVVIPVYNVERYLKQCLDSILTQTYTNLEIIIVNDKSPDKCPEIIDEYAKQDSRVKVIHNEENETFKAQNKNLLENARIFYTGSIDEYFSYKYGQLPYRSVNFKFETYDREFYQSHACINYPNNYDFTRIHEYKHYLQDKSEKTVIAKEYSEFFELGKNERYYPIASEENAKLYAKYLNDAKLQKDVYFLGRLGDYKYYNMDLAIGRAIELFEEVCK